MASGSRKRRMSQAVAVRFARMWRRVTHSMMVARTRALYQSGGGVGTDVQSVDRPNGPRGESPLAGAFSLTQLDPTDLAAHRLRQRVDELDLAGILVGCGDLLHVLLELDDELRAGGLSRA